MSNQLPPEAVEFFRDRLPKGHYEEPELVRAIKTYLLTDAQRAILVKYDWSIEDILNGRNEYPDADAEPAQEAMFADWNQRIGSNTFGAW